MPDNLWQTKLLGHHAVATVNEQLHHCSTTIWDVYNKTWDWSTAMSNFMAAATGQPAKTQGQHNIPRKLNLKWKARTHLTQAPRGWKGSCHLLLLTSSTSSCSSTTTLKDSLHSACLKTELHAEGGQARCALTLWSAWSCLEALQVCSCSQNDMTGAEVVATQEAKQGSRQLQTTQNSKHYHTILTL